MICLEVLFLRGNFQKFSRAARRMVAESQKGPKSARLPSTAANRGGKSLKNPSLLSLPDYWRRAYAKLARSRGRTLGMSDVQNGGPETGQTNESAWDPHERCYEGFPRSLPPFRERSELVTAVSGNIPLVICAGHGGMSPIPIDFDLSREVMDAMGDLGSYFELSPTETEGHSRRLPADLPPTCRNEEDAASCFVPVRTQRHLPGFALLGDAATGLLAELVFLDLLALLNPEVQIVASQLDLDHLAQSGLRVPHLVIARFARRFCDVNRPGPLACEHPAALAAHKLYHAHVARAVAQSLPTNGLLIDLHGQAMDPLLVVRGTLDGLTVWNLLGRQGRRAFDQTEASVLGYLETLDVSLFPSGTGSVSIVDSRIEVVGGQHGSPGHFHPEPPPFEPETEEPNGIKELPRYRGGWTVQRYGSHPSSLGIGADMTYDANGAAIAEIGPKPPGIDAIQLEFGRSYRREDTIWKTASSVAQSLAEFYRTFLVAPKPRVGFAEELQLKSRM